MKSCRIVMAAKGAILIDVRSREEYEEKHIGVSRLFFTAVKESAVSRRWKKQERRELWKFTSWEQWGSGNRNLKKSKGENWG